MKFTIVFTTLMCVSTSWAVLAKKVEEPKDKREAQVSYGVPGHSSHSYQAPASYSQGDASAISVGAGYSIGGAKPSYGFSGGSSGSEGLSPNGHATIQLAPITLQSNHGAFAAGDLSQIMSQLTHSLNTGGLSLQPSSAIAEFHQGGEGHQGAAQGQELSIPQFSYGSPKFELSQQFSAAPAYSTGTKGLGSYSTGPVLFTPSDNHGNAPAAPSATYGAASSGQSLGDAGAYSFGDAGHSLSGSGHSFGGSTHSLGSGGQSLGSSGHSFGGSGHSLAGLSGGSGHSLSGLSGSSGHSLAGLSGGSGHSLAGLSGGSSHSLAGLGGGSGHSLAGFSGGSGHYPAGLSGGSGHSLAGLSLGGAGHSFGGAYKQFSGNYGAPSKTSFKPSAFLGASVQGESGHGVSSLSGSYSAPSFSGFRGGLSLSSAGHGFGGSLGGFGSGSSKFIAPSYQSGKSEGLEGSVSSGHFASPPGTTYGIPSSSYSANNVHAASSSRPYFVNTKFHRASPSSFGQGSSAFKAPASSQSSYSSEPKYSFAGSNFHYEPSDAHVSASETSYNTIKYSEELKPRAN